MFRIQLYIILQFISGVLLAQQNKIDSVQKVLKGELSVNDRAIKMKDLAMYYETVDTAMSMKYYNDALTFAKKNKLDYETAVIFQNKSFLYTPIGNYEKAIAVLDSALLFLNMSNNEKKHEFLPKIYSLLSNNFRYQNNFKEAIKYQILGIKEFEKLKLYPNLVTNYSNLAGLYKEMNEFEKQLDCGKKSLYYAQILKDPKYLFMAQFQMAFAYTNLNRFDEALVYLNLNRKIYDPNYSVESLISYHLVSGLVYMNLNQLDNAHRDFSTSLKMATQANSVFSITQSQLQLARVLTLQKKFVEAELILNEIDQKKDNQFSNLNTLYDYYARLYEDSGDYKKALHYHKEFKIINDSLSNQDFKQYLSRLETQLETEQKEQQILFQKDQLQKRKLIISVLIVALFVLLLIAYLYYRNYTAKKKIINQKIKQLESEKQLMATESVIKGEEQERTRLAKDLHDGLGGMLSGIKYALNNMKGNLIMTPENATAFERSLDMLDSSIQEMRRVAHNMMPETLVKFGLDVALRDYCSDIHQNSSMRLTYQSYGLEAQNMEQSKSITVYRIVQELVNNALKHSGANATLVQLTQTDHHLSITVEDNGKGFDSNLLGNTKGIGWSNIQSRVDYLKGHLDIHSKSGEGTSVLIEITL